MEDGSPSAWSTSVTSTYDSSSEDSSANKQGALRLTDEEDPLIPNPADVHRTFCDGKATWKAFLDEASRIPSCLWPVDALDPYITLVDIPSLPEHLPSRSIFLYGRPCWELPDEIGGTACDDHYPDSNIALIHGRRVGLGLRTENPIHCDIYPDTASQALGIGSETTNSLAVLVMCWSYILSVRLLEMQGRPACTRRMVRNVPDNLEMRTSIEHVERDHQAINIRPSKKITFRMVSFLVEDAAGGRNWANADMSGKLEQHRWLRDWEGLYSVDEEIVEHDEKPTKPLLWFLEEWIEGKHE